MSKKLSIVLLLIFLSLIVLSACNVPFSGSEEKTVYVGPKMVECTGESPQMCLLVKENPNDEYTYFYDQIEGFDYEEGYEYVIRVKEETVDNPPAGGSSIRWILIDVVSKTPVSEASTVSGLEGIPWILQSYMDAKGEVVNVIAGREVTAEFNDNQINGNAGCNNYFGTYEVDGDHIAFSEIGSTEMFCEQPIGVMKQEIDYLAALSTASSFQMEDNQLIIANADGKEVLTFVQLKPMPFIGTEWHLEYYTTEAGDSKPLLPESEVSLIFNEDGRLSGSAGCNNYQSAYETEGSAIAIEQIVATRAYCDLPQGIMEQESAYLASLQSVAAYHIQGDKLTMEDADGQVLLAFKAFVEEEEIVPTPVEDTTGLIGSVWKWVEFMEVGQPQLIIDKPESYTIEFLPDELVMLKADCNDASGTYSVSNGEIEIEVTMMTSAACPEGSLADGFLRLLGDVVSYEVEDEFLYLYNANQTGRMVFSNAEEVQLPPTPVVTNTPVPTPTPKPTATVVPTPTPTSIPNIVFEDDLSTYTGWPLNNGSNYGFKLKDDAYYIIVDTPNGYVWSVRRDKLTDSISETDAVRVDGTESGYYGVVCRYQDGVNYYALVISESGAYGIAKMEQGLLKFIKQGEDKAGIIFSDGRLNRVRGDCIGDTLTLYANGEKLLEVQDTSFQEGKFGLIAITFAKRPLIVKFDQYVIYKP